MTIVGQAYLIAILEQHSLQKGRNTQIVIHHQDVGRT